MSNGKIQIFGEILPGVKYVERPGGYAFIQNEVREFAIIRTPNGIFLPGGGLDGDDPETGLRRELHEEMQFVLVKAKFLFQAIQYHWSEHYKSHFKKVGHFFEVEGYRPPGAKMEDEHSLLWLPALEAERVLTQEFQRWAIGTYVRGIAG
jgi:8-oxo-dGTP diphosphatase